MAQSCSMVVLLALLSFQASVALKAKSAAPELTSFELGCYMEEDPTGEEGGAKGKSYRGLVSSTVSGRTCQKWTADHPWKDAVDIKPTGDKTEDGSTEWGNGLGNHNYCRNPDQSEDKPWCYTMDPVEDHKKEVCEIPKCPDEARDFKSEAKDLSNEVALGLDCECSAQLYGSTTTTADTSVSLAQVWGKNKLGKKCKCKGKGKKHH
eukprot:gnl/TRDRNA2_/TRDRNA2_174426_c0_seq61.p1 gnl/TRDRNA2_/TRDRNA2_174426_c0~~gnl/TRDRNA2_/TRDRNA2_174426_c0_seq61.p1  ORF type:complete len:207 (-),score=55.12 gnl/TRDRNA2_/TRDRNA2_174426_c0_seq61:64-684(-)